MSVDSPAHCPRCGARLEPLAVEGRVRPACPSCSFVWYANPASAAAAVVFNARAELLLIRRALPPFAGCWALPAGYQELDENASATVLREVREEAGIAVEILGLLDLLFVPQDPRRPANVAVFLCRALEAELRAGDDASDARWFSLENLPEDIGFENYPQILARLRERSRYPESPWNLLNDLLGLPRHTQDHP